MKFFSCREKEQQLEIKIGVDEGFEMRYQSTCPNLCMPLFVGKLPQHSNPAFKPMPVEIEARLLPHESTTLSISFGHNISYIRRSFLSISSLFFFIHVDQRAAAASRHLLLRMKTPSAPRTKPEH